MRRFAASSAIVRATRTHFGESRPLIRPPIVKIVLASAALSGVLLLDGCGRAGMPVPINPSVSAKAKAAEKAPKEKSPTANSSKSLPHGINDNALKAGAPKGPTPFDFLL